MPKLTESELERLRDWLRHEDVLFASRVSYFVLAESILVLAAGSILTSGRVQRPAMLGAFEFIALVGFILTFSFWYVFRENSRLIHLISARLREHKGPHEEIASDHQDQRNASLMHRLALGRTPNWISSNVVSGLFLGLWLAMAAAGPLA